MLEIGEIINRSQYLSDSYPLDNFNIGEKIKTSFALLNQTKNKKVLLMEMSENVSYKLVAKYDISNEQIIIKSHILYKGTILFTLEKKASLNNLESLVQELVFELCNMMSNDL